MVLIANCSRKSLVFSFCSIIFLFSKAYWIQYTFHFFKKLKHFLCNFSIDLIAFWLLEIVWNNTILLLISQLCLQGVTNSMFLFKVYRCFSFVFRICWTSWILHFNILFFLPLFFLWIWFKILSKVQPNEFFLLLDLL